MSLPPLNSPQLEDPKKFLELWRAQRAYRVGKTFCYAGIVLALLCVAADMMWSPLLVVYADLLLLIGCALSLIWTKDDSEKPYFCWWPFYAGFWISMWPSLWATGGINSPLLGIFLGLLFLFGVIVQSKIKLWVVVVFVLAHVPIIFGLDSFFPFSAQPLPPVSLTGAMHTLGSLALGVCIYALLKTEKDLSIQFSDRYREAAFTKEELRKEEAANFAKTTFLANVSHELRTPLAAILGYTDLISKPGTSEADKINYTETLKRNGQQLARLVDDLLDLSKIEAGTVEVEKSNIKIGDILTDVLKLAGFTAEKKGLGLNVKYLNPIPEFIFTDPVRLRQIILNLVNNAVKFTERGQIKIQVENMEKPPGFLSITVTDTGRGILNHEIDRLFRPFSQGDPSLARRYGGTGLGLSLSKKLAEMLGGSLELADSQPGSGSSFQVTIPIGEEAIPGGMVAEFAQTTPAPTFEAETFSSDRLKGTKILFVDDTIDNQQLIRVYLNAVGADVDVASNGFEGVEKALSQHYDLVLMDVQMPLMDGYEAVTTLRARNYTRPILALTAHAMKEDWEKCISVGFNGHLSKPIASNALITAIESNL